MCYCKDGMYDNTAAYCVLALAIVKGINNPDVAYKVFYRELDVLESYRISEETVRQIVSVAKAYPAKTLDEIADMVGKSYTTVRQALFSVGYKTNLGWQRNGKSNYPPEYYAEKVAEIRRMHTAHPDWTNNRISLLVGTCWRFVDKAIKKEGKVHGN